MSSICYKLTWLRIIYICYNSRNFLWLILHFSHKGWNNLILKIYKNKSSYAYDIHDLKSKWGTNELRSLWLYSLPIPNARPKLFPIVIIKQFCKVQDLYERVFGQIIQWIDDEIKEKILSYLSNGYFIFKVNKNHTKNN